MTKQGGWPPSGFGERLRQLRTDAGLTQQQLAERSGCHPMTIAKLERGVQEPAWPLVQVLAKALGVNCLAFNSEEEASHEVSPGGPATGRKKRGNKRPRGGST
jgi:transcriptional regulator with XRE-family HTH domain